MASLGEYFTAAATLIYDVGQVGGLIALAVAVFYAWKKKWVAAVIFAGLGVLLFNVPAPRVPSEQKTGQIMRP